MPSPFPGMDPYLEGYLWPDVHHALASKIRQLLTPQLRPGYVARLEIQVIIDETPQSEIGIMYPDVEIVRQGDDPTPETVIGSASVHSAYNTPASFTIALPQAMRVRYATIQIRDIAENVLITNIEIISPVNKREPHLSRFREKRQKLYEAGVNIIEIDLIRRGTRPLTHPRIPRVPYLVTLTRSHSQLAQIWSIKLQDTLPTIPVPLRSPDTDVSLNLGAALSEVYDEAAYDRSINYGKPPPPPRLSPVDRAWVLDLLTKTDRQ